MAEQNINYLPRGTVIGGKYEVLRVAGTGGMSVVYQVNDTHLNKNWALKEVRKDGVKDFEVVRQGLVVETDMLKKLSHPYLPRIVDVIDDEGVFYVVMDFLEGQTLKDVLNKYGAQPQEDVVAWGIQLCEVLTYLHTRKPPIIFRDMKPGNVMLRPEGSVVLFDFGIAREFKAKNVADTTCLGTVGYAAPEQYGKRGQTDERTDIYGLGATLFHLVTGKNPNEPPYTIEKIRNINPSLSSGLEKIILKCTRDDPNERYQNCAELMYALENYTRIDEKSRGILKRKVAAFAACLAVSIGGFCLAGYSYNGIQQKRLEDYNDQLTAANEMALESNYTGEYDQGVLSQFAATIDIDPAREEGYLRLLDYTTRLGQTQLGLDLVCSHIDTGAGGIDQNDDVLLRVAELYFGGNNADDSFSSDYSQAARYFAKINKDKHPEAEYFGQLSEALGAFSADVNWDSISGTMDSFLEYNDRQILDTAKVRNYQLAAGVYTANKREFKALGKDPYELAIDLLGKAETGAEDLITDVKAGARTDTEEVVLEGLRKQILKDLANDYYTAYTVESRATNFDKAIDYYTKLLTMSDSENETRTIYFRIADVVLQKGEENQIRQTYEDLIARYGDSAAAYLEYASWLYNQGDLKAAAEQYKKASACEDASADSNYERIGIKLRNAGVLD